MKERITVYDYINNEDIIKGTLIQITNVSSGGYRELTGYTMYHIITFDDFNRETILIQHKRDSYKYKYIIEQY